MHELWLLKGNTITNITPLIGTISRRSNKDELGEEITFDIAFNDVTFFPKNPCDLGDVVIFKNGEKEITRAIIVDENKNGRDPVSYTAFDYAFYLNKSSTFRQFKKMRADQCIRKIVNDFNVPIGNIIPINFNIDKIYIDETPSDIIKDVLDQARKKLGVKFLMEMRQGKLYIEKQGDLTIKANFRHYPVPGQYDAMTAISNPSKTRSIVEMKNSIQIVSSDDKLILTRDDTPMINKYGRLQQVVKLDKDEKKSAAQIAQNELKNLSKVVEEASIELIGDDNVRAGRLIEVNEPITGLKGKYLINDVTHNIANGIHKMNLSLEVA